MAQTILSLRNVEKVYRTGLKEFKALDGVNLDIGQGKMIVVLGPSGAGKSTLLNLIGGMDTPTAGSVMVGGEDIARYSEKKLSDYRAQNIGFIFQFYNILPSLTVIENVELVREIVPTSMRPIEALEAVGLAEHKNKFSAELSGGEQQRVSIARAIAKKPKLLLCDEPTGALDSVTGATVLKLLKEQCEVRGTTVLIVTHNALIADIADTVVRVKNGKIESVTDNENPKPIDEVSW